MGMIRLGCCGGCCGSGSYSTGLFLKLNTDYVKILEKTNDNDFFIFVFYLLKCFVFFPKYYNSDPEPQRY